MTQAFKAHDVGLADETEHLATMEAVPQRIRAIFNGQAIADSSRVMVMHETKHTPVYYFPFQDVRMDLMEATERETF
jgi:uncharacterized protein (DUF427 family)